MKVFLLLMMILMRSESKGANIENEWESAKEKAEEEEEEDDEEEVFSTLCDSKTLFEIVVKVAASIKFESNPTPEDRIHSKNFAAENKSLQL